MEKFKKFIKDPSEKTVKGLDEYMYSLIYSMSTYCVRKKEGNIETARKLRNLVIPYLQSYVCFDRRGLKSLFLALGLISQIKPGVATIIVNIVDKGEKNLSDFKINYSAILENQYEIKQNYEKLGVKKELALYLEGVKDYFKDMFQNDTELQIEKITIKIGEETKTFYEKDLGVIWGIYNKKCLHCTRKMLAGESISDKCKKLLENKCYEKFKNRPKQIFIKEHEGDVEKVDLSKKQKGWECESCFLLNPENIKKCRACKEPRPTS